MNNQPIQLITDDKGLNSRPVNAHKQYEDDESLSVLPLTVNYYWEQFELSAKWLPLTTKQAPNSLIMGNKVMMEHLPFYKEGEWSACELDGFDPICTTGADHKLFYEPIIEHPVAEKQSDVSVEEAAIEHLTNSHLIANERQWYINGARFGWDKCLQSKQLVEMDKVIAVLNRSKVTNPTNYGTAINMQIDEIIEKLKSFNQ